MNACIHYAYSANSKAMISFLNTPQSVSKLEGQCARNNCQPKPQMTVLSYFFPIVLLIAIHINAVVAWSTIANPSLKRIHAPSEPIYPTHAIYQHHRRTTQLFGGVGTATTYSWKEEQFEIEVSISVPPNTAAKDIKFKCTSNGIDLRLSNNEEEQVLLDGSRNTRGKICVDGTYWSITDGDRTNDGERLREITVVIEKQFIPTSSAGGVMTYDSLTDFDWGGLYPNDEEEVTFREYEEAEELNVRDYAAKLGVDIDNIDMSKVDKTMFGAGLRDTVAAASDVPEENVKANSNGPGTNLNITQSTLDQLVKFGLAKEVVRQGDGTEYEMDAFSTDMERKEFSMLGRDISVDELRDAGVVGSPMDENTKRGTIPKVVGSEVQKADNESESTGAQTDELKGDKSFSDLATKEEEDDNDEDEVDPNAKDPIDKLTVKKLKEVLRKQGLKVSGNKSELQERLRAHVQSLLEESASES